MTTDELAAQHGRFLKGQPGRCVRCGSERGLSFADEDEVDSGVYSRHDTYHFVWLDGADPLEGYLCDDCVDALVAAQAIEAYRSELNGVPDLMSEAGAVAAFKLGVRRMQAVLALANGAEASVDAEAVAGLPLSFPGRQNMAGRSPWDLVHGFAAAGAPIDDPESCGRFTVLTHAVVQGPAWHVRSTAEDWAAAYVARKRGEQEMLGTLGGSNGGKGS